MKLGQHRRPGHATISSISHLVAKLTNFGLFPSVPANALPLSLVSFFAVTLPKMQERIHSSGAFASDCAKQGASVWPAITASLSHTNRSQIATSLIMNLDKVEEHNFISSSDGVRRQITMNAVILRYVFGSFVRVDDDEVGDLWDIVGSTALAKHWDVFTARIYVTWVAGVGDKGSISGKMLHLR